MNVSEFMEKHGLDSEALDEMAAPYERGDYKGAEGTVFSGSHLDTVGKKRITVIYDASAAQQAAVLARKQGVKTSEVYRNALDYYLAAQS